MKSEHLFDPAPYTVPEYDPACPCKDCGAATMPSQYYWVHDCVWQAAGMTRGFLCIACLESRLDRQLVPQDFPDLPINVPDAWDSPRLRALKMERSAS